MATDGMHAALAELAAAPRAGVADALEVLRAGSGPFAAPELADIRAALEAALLWRLAQPDAP
jgi:hypothetical protein